MFACALPFLLCLRSTSTKDINSDCRDQPRTLAFSRLSANRGDRRKAGGLKRTHRLFNWPAHDINRIRIPASRATVVKVFSGNGFLSRAARYYVGLTPPSIRTSAVSLRQQQTHGCNDSVHALASKTPMLNQRYHLPVCGIHRRLDWLVRGMKGGERSTYALPSCCHAMGAAVHSRFYSNLKGAW